MTYFAPGKVHLVHPSKADVKIELIMNAETAQRVIEALRHHGSPEATVEGAIASALLLIAAGTGIRPASAARRPQ